MGKNEKTGGGHRKGGRPEMLRAQQDVKATTMRTNFTNFVAHLFYFLYTSVRAVFFSLILDWTAVFRNPLETVLKIILVPVTAITMATLAILLLFLRVIGAGRLLDYIADTVYEGRCVANWGDPNPLGDPEVEAGLALMEDPKLPHVFNPKIAKVLLFFSSLLYEDSKNATDILYKTLKNVEVKTCEVVELKEQSSVGDFVTLFHVACSKSDIKTMILTFRGTSPLDLDQWLLDCSINKMDASEYLFGSVHEGFFRTLFLNRRGVATNAYKEIVAKIQKCTSDDPGKYRLWVTGHSLGGALASLFFARGTKSSEIAGAELCSSYTFGSPRVGNLEFRNRYTFDENIPFFNKARMYRVYNANDPIPHVPFGFDNPNALALTRGGSGLDTLDYCHIGTPIYLHRHNLNIPDKHPMFIVQTPGDLYHYLRTTFLVSLNVSNILDWFLGWRDVFSCFKTFLSARSKTNFYKFLVTFIAHFVGVNDHTPSSYLKNLSNGKHIQLIPINSAFK